MKNISLAVWFSLLLALCGCASPGRETPTQAPASLSSLAPAAPTQTPAPTLPPPSPTPQPSRTPTGTPQPTPTPTPVIFAGAGDIAYCGEAYLADEATADLLARLPGAHIFTAGDNVSGVGTRAEFTNCYAASWGKFKDRTRPSPGNHDYQTEGGAPYYEYFGEAAGEAGKGYYSYDLGGWHIVALNSNCDDIACGRDSQQAAWLREDLAASENRCTLLYWHHPRWSSGLAGSYGSVSTFWRIAVEMGAEVVVSGNDHDYERFAPQDGDGNSDSMGVRQFVVGTGGSELRVFGEIKPNSEVRKDQTYGIIAFRLYPDRYEWEFLSTTGDFSDSGSAECH